MTELSHMTREDEAARERLNAATAAMQARTCAWSDVNTGSWNTDGLKSFSGDLANAFSELKGDVRLQEAPGFETIDSSGKSETIYTGLLCAYRPGLRRPFRS